MSATDHESDATRPDSYPPARHLLRDLQVTSVWRNDEELVVRAPVPPGLRTAPGAVRLGAIAAVVDIAAAQVAITAVDGDWIATTDLSVTGGAPIVGDSIELVVRALRVGSKMVLVRGVLAGDRPDSPGGVALVGFRRIPRSASRYDEPARGREIGVERTMDGAPDRFSVQDATAVMGVHEVAPGVVELARSEYVVNSFGTIAGSATALTVEAAARSLVSTGSGSEAGWVGSEAGSISVGSVVTDDVTIRYVGQTDAPSIRATAEWVRRGERPAVEVVVTDAADPGTPPIAVALVSLRTT